MDMDKCDVGNYKVVVTDGKKDVDLCGQNDEKSEKWHKQKIVSGLGEMLKQLKVEFEECEEEDESESTAVTETGQAVVKEDGKENELLKEPIGCEEIIETEEAPGLAKAQKTFDQLGYVFETDLGERFPETPAIRFVLLCCEFYFIKIFHNCCCLLVIQECSEEVETAEAEQKVS